MSNIKWFSVLAVIAILAAILSGFFGGDGPLQTTRTITYAILSVAFAVLAVADRR